jgi:ribosome-binding factor A
MAKEFSRTQRVADFLQRELATLIHRALRDPRLPFISVTGVEVSRDLSSAKVYITFLDLNEDNNNERRKEGVAILNKAAGFLRSELSRDSRMRHMPQLRFKFDSSIERGRHMMNLIDEATRLESDNED